MLALGLVETRGLLAAVEGADAMLKAADVRLLEKNLATGGLVTISVAGEVAAVQAAVDAAGASIRRIAGAELISVHVIPRPDQELTGVLLLAPDPDDPRDASYFRSEEDAAPAADAAPAPAQPEPEGAEDAPAAPPSDEAAGDGGSAKAPATRRQTNAQPGTSRLRSMSLNRLRQMARTVDGLSMTEDEIASADKKSLIAAISRALRKI